MLVAFIHQVFVSGLNVPTNTEGKSCKLVILAVVAILSNRYVNL